jgi:hypothetical protein
VALEPDGRFFTSFSAAHWPALFNGSGRGLTRFAPFLGRSGAIVPTLYGSRTRTVALLETVFHDVHETGRRDITTLELRRRGLAAFSLPGRLALVDLRDNAVAQLGLSRGQLLTTSSRHYRCTGEWAAALYGRGIGSAKPVGLLWRSRVAELARAGSALFADLLPGSPEDVFVLFGDLLRTTDPSAYAPLVESDDLSSPLALRLLAPIAQELGATLV